MVPRMDNAERQASVEAARLALEVSDRAAALARELIATHPTRGEVDTLVEKVAESTRREFASALTTVQVQIGATEKSLLDKIGSLKAWGVAGLIGGQTLAGVAASYLAPHQTSVALHYVLHLL